MTRNLSVAVWLRITGKKNYSWKISKVEAFSRQKPACNANQIAVKMDLQIPETLFEEPSYEIKATLPPPEAGVTHAEISKELSKALSERLGMKVTIKADAVKATFGDELRKL